MLLTLATSLLVACGSSAGNVATPRNAERSPSASASASASPTTATEPSAGTGVGVLAWSRVVGTPAPGERATASLIVEGSDGEPEVLDDGLVARTPPAWSPDGRALAYLAHGGLVVGTVDGTASSRLMACRAPACLGLGAPAWSPDGGSIALGWSGERGDGLAVVDVDDGDMRIVADVVVDGSPAWSADAKRIAVPSADRIEVVDADDGSGVASVPFGGDIGERLSWSPDGETFAVAGMLDGVTGVYLVPVDGGDPTLLTTCPDDGCVDLDPAWSPDGARVLFTRGRCDVPGGDCFTGDLYAVAPGGGEPAVVVGGPELDCCGAWQPVRPVGSP